MRRSIVLAIAACSTAPTPSPPEPAVAAPAVAPASAKPSHSHVGFTDDQCAANEGTCDSCFPAMPFHITTRDPVACTVEGATCAHEDWEHGCRCVCTRYPAGLYWACTGDTQGSICARPPGVK